jgi:lipoprotein-releasing system permease protein
MNQQLFSLLKLQQVALFIVLGLIVFVSMFNIVSTLVMTVHEKRQEIGILGSMGATPRLVRRVFVGYGLIVGSAGTLTGLTLGSIICWILTRWELISFGPEIAEVYFVSSIPFVTRPFDLGVIAAFTMTISLLASLLPSFRASRLTPVDALRHE